MAELYLRHWEQKDPRAVIVLIHGLGEFVDRYDWVAEQFGQQGYAVVGADLPGHGKTAVKRGHIDTFREFLDAVDSQVKHAETLYPGIPLVLFGHSMGGLILVRHLQTRTFPANVRAVLLSSPSLQTATALPQFLVTCVRFLSRVWPTLQTSTSIKAEDISRSDDIRAFYATNTRVLHKVSARLLVEFIDAMQMAVTSRTRLDVPILVLQAGSDKLVSASTSSDFVEALEASDKQYKVYPQCYHELLNEPERADVFRDLAAWLDVRLPQV